MGDGFSKEQEALIEKVAWTVGNRLSEDLSKRMDDKIELHNSECKTQRMQEAKNSKKTQFGVWVAIITIVIAASALSVSIAVALAKG